MEKLSKKQVQKRVLHNGSPLALKDFIWDEKTNTFSTKKRGLVIDFADLDSCIFDTGSRCTFNTGSNCTFKTGSNCTFETLFGCAFETYSYCIFKTGDNCTFNTGSNCTFETGFGCTFKTGSYCTFDTKSSCTFKTDNDCTFNAGSGCAFDTSFGCTFKTESYCIFDTASGCIFKTGSDCTFNTGFGCTFDTVFDCIFKTDSDCNFKTGFGCTFKAGSNCAFNTGSDCTFNTANNCTFKTNYNCTFNTSNDCTFNTSYSCTFKTSSKCVIIRRDMFQIIQPEAGEVIKTCSSYISGYISKRIHETCFYKEVDGKRIEHIIADGILSRVVSKRSGVYKVIKSDLLGPEKETFLIEKEGIFSHGDTLKQAKESWMYKISNRDTSMYEDLTLDSVVSLEKAIKMYRTITGSCETETKSFVENLKNLKKEYSIKEVLALTEGAYENKKVIEFFKK